jgi:hypothetical protein
LADARVQSEHVQVIRSDIEAESVENCKDVEMSKFQKKKAKAIPLGSILKHRYILLRMKTAF